MTHTGTDPLTIAVWISMADHFLDTETRHDLPLTALCCVQAGLSPAQARDVWQHEVTPAVGFNLFSVAGEWAYWDRDWLLERIQRVRSSWWHRPGWQRRRWPMPLMGGHWLAIERSIEFLQAVPAAAERELVARDLARLARHLFDFCPKDLATLAEDERARLRLLYPAPFSYLMESALGRTERADAEQRVQRAVSSIAPGAGR
jgi:hypothetical protein